MTQQCHSLLAYCTIYGPTATWAYVVQYAIRKCIIFNVANYTTCIPSFLLSKLDEHRQIIALTSSHGDSFSQAGSKNAGSVPQYSNTAHIAIRGERVKHCNQHVSKAVLTYVRKFWLRPFLSYKTFLYKSSSILGPKTPLTFFKTASAFLPNFFWPLLRLKNCRLVLQSFSLIFFHHQKYSV